MQIAKTIHRLPKALLRNLKPITKTYPITTQLLTPRSVPFHQQKWFSTDKIQESILQAKQEAKTYLKSGQKLPTEVHGVGETEIIDRLLKINSTEKFVSLVVQNPKPTIVYCLTNWSQNCKDFLPKILDKFILNNNTWDLAVFDIDSSPQLTTQLGIKTVPTTILVSNGNIIDGLMGVPNETELAQFFKAIETLLGLMDKKGLHKKYVQQIKDLYLTKEASKWEEILGMLTEDEDMDVNLDLFTAMLLAYRAYSQGEFSKADEIIDTVSNMPRENKLELDFIDKVYMDIIDQQRKAADGIVGNPRYSELMSVWEKSEPKEQGIGLELAEICVENEKYIDAIDVLLKIIGTDKTWEKAKVMKCQLGVFKVLGNKHELVIASRKKLATILF